MTDRVVVTNQGLAQIFGNAKIGHSFVFVDPKGISLGENPIFQALAQLGFLSGVKPQIIPLWGNKDTVEVLGAASVKGNSVSAAPFGAILTDKDLYTAGKGVAHVFVAVLNQQEVSVQIKLNGQNHSKRTIAIGTSGMAKFTIGDLQSGEYSVTVEGAEHISANFTAAEYKLAALEASLLGVEFKPEEDRIVVNLHLEGFGVPLVNRPVDLQLREEGRRRGQKTGQTDQYGNVQVEFSLADTEQSLSVSIQVLDDAEKTAEVALRGAKAEERKLTLVNPLGQQVEVSLLPMEGAQEERGLNFRAGAITNTPFYVMNVIGDQAEIIARQSMPMVVVSVIDPIRGGVVNYTFNDVEASQTLTIDTPAPWAMIAVGAFIKEGENLKAWEGWTTTVRQSELTISVTAPEMVEPGQDAVLHLETSTECPVVAAVIVRDIRLTASSSGQNGMARAMKHGMDENGGKMKVGEPSDKLGDSIDPYGDANLESFGSRRPVFRSQENAPDFRILERRGGREESFDDLQYRGSRVGFQPDPFIGVSKSPIGFKGGVEETSVAVQILVAMMAPRLKQAETIYAEICMVEGSFDLAVTTGDPITSYEVEVFALDVAMMDWAEDVTSFRASKATFAEIQTAPFVAPGDKALSTIHVETQTGRASVSITHNGRPVSFLLGNDIVESGTVITTPANLDVLTGDGELVVDIDDTQGDRDVVSTQIGVLGKFTHRAKRLTLLRPGQSATLQGLSALNMTVVPGLDGQLTKLTHSLSDYGHACCEQTSAIMTAALIMALQGDEAGKAHFLRGVEREKTMFLPGQGFAIYPGYHQANDHYGRIAARQLYGLRHFNTFTMDAEITFGILEAFRMGESAMRAYREPTSTVNPTSMQQIYDAAFDGGLPNSHLLAKIKSALKVEGVHMFIPGRDKVTQRAETAYAAAALARLGEIPMAIACANWVVSQFDENGRLYSTIDSLAAMLMMQELQKVGVVSNGSSSGQVKINGHVMDLTAALAFNDEIREIAAVDSTVAVQYEVELTEDWDAFASVIPIEIALMKGRLNAVVLRPGDSVELVVKLPGGYRPGLLAHVALPPALTWVRGGGQVRRFTVDFEGKSEVRIPLAVLGQTLADFGRVGQQSLRVLVRNMFIEEEAGSTGPIFVRVQ